MDPMVKTIFLRIFRYRISDVGEFPISPYTTPREVSRILGGETETQNPSPQDCFPSTRDPDRKKEGWAPMADD